MMDGDLPFTAEYAKSSRASCKVCKENIAKDSLRIGVMVQSPRFDGKVPLWHHCHCFLKKKKVKTIGDIANFNNLRWEDQKKIKDKLDNSSNGVTAESSCSDFSIEYAKSSRSTCKECEEKILKGVVRISKIDTESADARRYGPVPKWHHVDCFVKIRQDLGFIESADKLPGYKSLSEEDKEEVNAKLACLTAVKRKLESESPLLMKKKRVGTKEETLLREQNQLIYEMRDKLKGNMSKKDMISLLEYNNQHVSTGESNILDNLSDCLVFGALKVCPDCKVARPRFKIDAYRCAGNVTEWTKCQFVTKSPEREPFKIPEEFKEKYEFLSNYQYVKRDRHFMVNPEPSSSKKSLPLENYKIAVLGKFKGTKSALLKGIVELGGKVVTKVDGTVMCCISTEAEVAEMGPRMEQARKLDVHIVSANFLEALKKGMTPAIAMKENTLSSWGGDPILKFGIKKEKGSVKSEASTSSSFSKSAAQKSQKLKLTAGSSAAVEPDSGLEDEAHVLNYSDVTYNVVLGVVDVIRGTNTYYKLQILESNKGKKYWLFRSWGRVGTTIGGNKLEKFKNVEEARSAFMELYLEKTGNEWRNHKQFVKKPGLLYPLDIDYGQDCQNLKELKPGANSKLPKPVQELICLIFDIEAMKKAMVEFEIDLQKMPLGKLSRHQIEKAYTVLAESQQILVTGCNATKILDVSNRFYTLIPHDFGLKKPPLLDDEELIKSKIEMLDSLLEIEFAYSLLKDDGTASQKDPVDEHYEKLNTDIETLDKDSDEYNVVKTYLNNTHAKTHDSYTLQLKEVFKINRQGESEKYQKFKDLHNKKLLWHGSRLTNYVGILSQGLRIAPPEAPVTGYMFGKGVYFADMVSKSANYCFTNKQNSTGLMLLCEVALGNMYEKTNSEFITKLPIDKHSTLGLGQTVPDPEGKMFIGDVEVPCGKPVRSDKSSVLLYNEYIVYDVSQINIKYLLKVNFKWKW